MNKKIILSVLAILITLCLILTGCGKNKEDENKDVKWLDIENLEDYISENDKLMIPIYRKELRDYGKQTD